MSDNIAARNNVPAVSQRRNQVIDAGMCRRGTAISNSQAGRMADEVLSVVKDYRMNAKRAISADIAATARVQNQNDRVIALYERELRRKDLTDERRDELLDRVSRMAESTARANEESREFQRQQLENSRRLPWRLIGTLIAAAVLGIGGVGFFR